MTIKQELLLLGLPESDFDYLGPNLLVRVNKISWHWLSNFKEKERILSFEYQNEKWFEIIDGCIDEYNSSRKPFSAISFNQKRLPHILLNEFYGEDFFSMYNILYRIFKTDAFTYEKNTSYASFAFKHHPSAKNARFLTLGNAKLKAVTFNNKKEVIAIYENIITSTEEHYTIDITV